MKTLSEMFADFRELAWFETHTESGELTIEAMMEDFEKFEAAVVSKMGNAGRSVRNGHSGLVRLLKDAQRWTPAAVQEDPDYYQRKWLPAWQKRVDAAITKAEAE